MTSQPGCIDPQELRAFLLGDLPERRSGAVARHLEGCAACEAEASRLDELTDPVLLSLRRALAGAGSRASRT
jgi:anti-sigma factor RsiW